MAKLKKRRLRWTASSSSQVVGYKLYWEQDGVVTYDSPSAALGNVTEIVLPDDVDAFSSEDHSGPFELGITAVDELGNESDLITVSAPYQFNVPQAPNEIWFERQDPSSAEQYLDEDEDTKSGDLLFLEHDFDDEDDDETANTQSIADNAVGNDSFRNRKNISIALQNTENT